MLSRSQRNSDGCNQSKQTYLEVLIGSRLYISGNIAVGNAYSTTPADVVEGGAFALCLMLRSVSESPVGV
jgi:hypothetical protein